MSLRVGISYGSQEIDPFVRGNKVNEVLNGGKTSFDFKTSYLFLLKDNFFFFFRLHQKRGIPTVRSK